MFKKIFSQHVRVIRIIVRHDVKCQFKINCCHVKKLYLALFRQSYFASLHSSHRQTQITMYYKARSTPATMSEQRSTLLPKNGNNIERVLR